MSEPVGILDYLGVDEDKFSWHDLGLCRSESGLSKEAQQSHGELFYETYETDYISAEQVDTICGGCPVRSQCLEAGQENREWGVWGGVYWDGSGKPDLDRNAHKTWEEWEDIMRYVYIPEKTVAEIRRRLEVR